ncbi:morphogenic membrane protein MmpA [Streptomyces sp. NPDC003327]
MTTPVPTSSTPVRRGLALALLAAGGAALAWVCAMLYVLVAWVAG